MLTRSDNYVGAFVNVGFIIVDYEILAATHGERYCLGTVGSGSFGKFSVSEFIDTGDVILGYDFNLGQFTPSDKIFGCSGQEAEIRGFVGESELERVSTARGSSNSAITRLTGVAEVVGCRLCLFCGNGYGIACAVVTGVVNSATIAE